MSISIFLCTSLFGQKEYVVNGDFEQNNGAPVKDGDFTKLKHWFNPSEDFEDNYNFGTPDYFHMRGKAEVKLPFTNMGTVFARSGSACSGLVLYTDNDDSNQNFREYIAVKLASPLKKGEEYELTLHYTNGSDKQYGRYECRSFGVGFSVDRPKQYGHDPIRIKSKKRFDNIRYDIEWVETSLKFRAKKSYQYLVFGNFWNDRNTEISISEIANSSANFAYVFIDDVSLIRLDNNDSSESEESFTSLEDEPMSRMDRRVDTVEVIREVIREVPVEVIREVILEVPVEVIKEQVDTVEIIRIREVIKERIDTIEVIREVPIEVVAEEVDTVEVIKIREVIKERVDTVVVIREVPSETVTEMVDTVEVIKIREVIKERVDTIEIVKEVIKEVPVEVVVERIDTVEKIVEVPVSSESDFASTILKGETLILDIHFKADSFNIKPKHYFEVRKILSFLKEYNDIVVEISGHTNGVPSHDYCNKLSTLRANSIRTFLLNEGVAEDQIVAKGYGKTQPIANNKTRSGRKLNQRVEVKLIKIKTG